MDLTKEQAQREEFCKILFELAKNQEMLQDTIAMALNEALEQIQKESDEIQEKVTGQSGLPF